MNQTVQLSPVIQQDFRIFSPMFYVATGGQQGFPGPATARCTRHRPQFKGSSPPLIWKYQLNRASYEVALTFRTSTCVDPLGFGD